MADVDITSLSVEISAESEGAELNIEKLATALSKLKTKSEVGKTIDNLTKLTDAIEKVKSSAAGMSGLDQITGFIEKLSQTDASASVTGFNSLSNSIKKVAAATATMNGTDFYALGENLRQVSNALAPLSILNVDNIKNIGSVFNSLNKIPDLTAKLDSATLDSFADACGRISTALTPLSSQLEKVSSAFNQLPAKLKQVVTATNKVTAATQKAKSGYKGLSSQLSGFASVMKSVVSFRALVKVTSSAIKSFNDYYEAANFFGVVMKDLTEEANDFIEKMNELLGIDPTEAMNNMSKIQSLTTSFGMASDQAYILSKNLTQLGYDLSSLQNLDVDQAFTKLQAAISGELEPIRRLGVDLSQARLQQELLDLGFQENISTLSQADKAVLRYIAIMKQTTDAQGDFAKTIDSPANSLKVLKAQVEGLARAVGSVLYPALSKVLPIAIATVEVIKEAVQAMAALVGVKVEFPDFDSVSDSSSALDSVTESAEEAKKALKNYSIGIDELNVISPTDSSSSSSGTGNILGDIDLSKYEYDMFAEYVGNSVDEIKEKIKGILPIVEAIGVCIAGWALVDFISGLGKTVEELQKAITLASTFKELFLGIGLVTIGATLEFTGIKDALENGLDAANIAEIIAGTLSLISGGALIADALTKWFADAAVSNAIKAAGGSMGSTFVGAMAGGAIAGIGMFVMGLYDALKNGLDETSALLIPVGTTAAGATIGGIVGALGGPIGSAVGAAIGLAIGALADAMVFFYQEWDNIVDAFSDAWDSFSNWANESFTGFLQSVKDWLDGVKKKIDEKVEPFASAMSKLLNAFSAENVAKVVSDWGTKLKEGLDGAVSKAKELINGNTLLSAGKDLIQGLINGVNSMIKSVVDTVGSVATSIIDKAKNVLGINSPSKVFYEIGDFVDQGLANGISAGAGLVQSAMNSVVNIVTENGQNMIDSAVNTASGYVTSFANTLDSEWEKINYSLQTDFFGSIETLWNAISNGDLESLGKWAAAFFYNAMDEEQKAQIIKVAEDSLSQLNDALSGVWQRIAGMAASYIGELVPSTLTATAAQEGLNIAMDSNPIGLIISLIGMLAGTLISFAGTNSSVANIFTKAWQGVYTVVSYLFEGLVRIIGVAAQGFISAVNLMIKAYNLVAGIFGGKELAMLENPLYAWADKIAASRENYLNQNNSDSGSDESGILSDSYQYQYELLKKQYDELKKEYSDSLSNGLISGGSSGKIDTDYSKYPGTSDYENSNGSYNGGYTSSSTVHVDFNEAEMRDSVYNGTYNAFLDIFQRYGDELTGGKELKVYLDGKQITASVEKRQSERGQSLMGNEVYAY